jgi:hypothetical protein
MMYVNGQRLSDDRHFQDHLEQEVPVQIYYESSHSDIGFVEAFCSQFVKVNNIFYNRHWFTFVSRPGY